MKKVKYAAPFIMSAIVLAACQNATMEESTKIDELTTQYVTYSDEDFYTAWQNSNFTKVELNGESAVADGPGGVVIEKGNIVIRTSGTYVLEGSLNNGQIIIDTEDKGTVRLVLNGVSITSNSGPVIHVKQSEQTVISLEQGTENKLEDAKEYLMEEEQDEPSAAIFSKDDLSINGTGRLIIHANYKDGIAGRDDVIITGGEIEIQATDDGIMGRDLLAIRDAKIKIDALGDGIKSTNDEDEQKGHIVLQSGSFDITAGSDGIQSERDVLVIDGKYTITAGGGSPETVKSDQGAGAMMPDEGTPRIGRGSMSGLNPSQIQQYIAGTITKEELLESIDKNALSDGTTIEEVEAMLDRLAEGGMPQGDNGMEPPTGEFDPVQAPSVDEEQQTPPAEERGTKEGNMSADSSVEEGADDSISTKGIKAANLVQIEGGTFTIDANDDAVHSNGDVVIRGGAVTINTGDDGIHADHDVVISDGVIKIDKSYEGIEGTNITVKGGDIAVIAADDGVNISGGSSDLGMYNDGRQDAKTEEKAATALEEGGLLLIEDGSLYVNAEGDGLDSNTNIHMTGGTVVVYGPTNGGNGALDYDGTFTLEGGTLIAAGSSGMAMGVSDTSSQAAVMMTFTDTQAAGTIVNLVSEEEAVLASVAPEKEFQTLLISTAELKQETDYTIGFGGTVKGERKDGLALYASSMIDEKGSVSFTLPAQIMTYVNESGVTENSGNTGIMPGGRPGGEDFRGGRRGTENQDNQEQDGN